MKKLIYILIVFFSYSNLFGQEIQEKNTEINYQFVEEAQFPGGQEAMVKYISDNINYPQIAVKKHIEGKCYVKFVVSKTGEIEDVKLIKGVQKCPECDEEAVRVIKTMPKWTPAMSQGKAIETTIRLPINFVL